MNNNTRFDPEYDHEEWSIIIPGVRISVGVPHYDELLGLAESFAACCDDAELAEIN